MDSVLVRNILHKLIFATAFVLILAGCSNPITPPTPLAQETQPIESQTGNPGTSAESGSLPTPGEAGHPPGTTPTAVEVGQPPAAPVDTPLPVPTQAPYLPALPVWGIESYAFTKNVGLDFVQESGAYWVRRNALLWSEVEPLPGERNWAAISSLESELEATSALGLQMILVIRSTPEWAQSVQGSLCSAPTPESLEAFGAFIYDAVLRYSVPPYNVQYWEIGNEPDVQAGQVPSDSPFGCWGIAGDTYFGGEYYGDILKTVYPKVKSANPQAQVLVGGLLLDCDPVNPPETAPGSGQIKDCTSSRYLEGALLNGAGDYFDGISFHSYDYYAQKFGEFNNANWNSAWNTTGPAVIAKANYLRGLLSLFSVSDKYLMNTESALLCGRDGSEAECQVEAYRLTKAYYLAQAYATAIAEQLRANVWYSLTGWRATGLLESGNVPNEAYRAFQTSAGQLNGAGYRTPILEFPGVRGYEFEQDSASLWVIWSLDGAEHTIQLEQPVQTITDVFGAQLTPVQEVTITSAPLYIQFSK